MKTHIHLTIDYEKKMLFESTKECHKKTFSDILAEGIDACLAEIVPSKLIEEEIMQTKQRVFELEQDLVKAKMVEEQMKLQQKTVKQDEDSTDRYLEEMRTKRFSEHIESSLKMLRNGSQPNWKKMAPLYQFSNENELKNWFFDKMNSEGIVL